MDVVIDFAGYPAGTEIILRNDDVTLPLLPAIMKFIVTGNPGYTGAISSTLRTVTPMTEASADQRAFLPSRKASKQGLQGRLGPPGQRVGDPVPGRAERQRHWSILG